jgi:hypothetical protein
VAAVAADDLGRPEDLAGLVAAEMADCPAMRTAEMVLPTLAAVAALRSTTLPPLAVAALELSSFARLLRLRPQLDLLR